MSTKNKKQLRQIRHVRLRKTVTGTTERPRLSVCCTSKHMYVQVIDDSHGHTLAAVSTVDKAFREGGNKANLAGATALGKLVAERAKAAQVSSVVFDRGGFRFHGRVKAIAEAAREAGLQF